MQQPMKSQTRTVPTQTAQTRTKRASRSSTRRGFTFHHVKYPIAGAAAIIALSVTAIVAIVPPGAPSSAETLKAYIHEHAQSLTVTPATALVTVQRDKYSGTPGIATLAASGTNYDWAKMVLLDGGWPQTDNSVTVMVRWMRQENGADNWWNRNNPLNNGWGSGGGGGTGSYATLEVAAQMAVAMLKQNPGMAEIVAALAAGAPSSVTESAIWASPWASSHYGNGSRWHYTPVATVKAPTGW